MAVERFSEGEKVEVIYEKAMHFGEIGTLKRVGTRPLSMIEFGVTLRTMYFWVVEFIDKGVKVTEEFTWHEGLPQFPLRKVI